MFKQAYDKLCRPLVVLCGVFAVFSVVPSVAASPFGQGVFGAQVPFGSVTSLTINLGSNVNLTVAPSGPDFIGSGSHTITVTSTDVVGYSLYIYARGSTAMTNGTDTIPASTNGTAAPLLVNTWGYNIDGSTNYIGITNTPALLTTATGPYESGNNTTVKFGVRTDITKSSGNYTTNVTYTAVALTD